MIILKRIGAAALILSLLFFFSPSISARDYIEIWPEGWSEITPLFRTSIFTDRYFVTNDSFGVSFLSVDGVYFRELDVTYRLLQDGELKEQVVLRAGAEIDSAHLTLEDGVRHVLWLERGVDENTIYYTEFSSPYQGHEPIEVVKSANPMQNMAAYHRNGTTHVVWAERDGSYQIKYAQITAGELAALETLTDTPDLSIRPSVIVDGEGIVHVAWMETDPVGTNIYYKRRDGGQWSSPQRVGPGSVQDIQQGGLIAMELINGEVHMAWSAIPRNRSFLFVYLAEISAQGEISEPTLIAEGSRARFVRGAEGVELVWQGMGQMATTQVNYSADGDVTNLTVGRRGAFRPEGIVVGDYRYVFWLQAHPEGGYQIHGINNEFPKPISLWRRMGLDEEAPLYHLVFLLSSTLMLAGVYTIGNSGVLVVGGLLVSLLQRFERYKKQPLFYKVVLTAVVLALVRRLPIPATHPQNFGLIHYGVSLVIATLGSFLLLRKMEQRGLFLTMANLILWMFLFQFFALIPQVILR